MKKGTLGVVSNSIPPSAHLHRALWGTWGIQFRARGIEPDPNKVKAVQEFPVPTTVRGVRRFLGMAGYYRRFMAGFAKITAPLHALTRESVPFFWSIACQGAFQALKDLLMTPPVLAYPNFDRDFILHTDASIEGLGAVLEQVQDDGKSHPIAYASRSLSKAEKNYGITELEALGVVWAAKHFTNFRNPDPGQATPTN